MISNEKAVPRGDGSSRCRCQRISRPDRDIRRIAQDPESMVVVPLPTNRVYSSRLNRASPGAGQTGPYQVMCNRRDLIGYQTQIKRLNAGCLKVDRCPIAFAGGEMRRNDFRLSRHRPSRAYQACFRPIWSRATITSLFSIGRGPQRQTHVPFNRGIMLGPFLHMAYLESSDIGLLHQDDCKRRDVSRNSMH